MRLKAFFSTVFATIGSAFFTIITQPAYAQVTSPVVIAPPSSIGGVNVDPNQLISFIINAIIVVGIVLSLIFLLYGGVRWILSGGDKGKVDAARSTIVAAIVGLIIVILAYVIINAVLKIFTGKSLIDGFAIPSLVGTPVPTRP